MNPVGCPEIPMFEGCFFRYHQHHTVTFHQDTTESEKKWARAMWNLCALLHPSVYLSLSYPCIGKSRLNFEHFVLPFSDGSQRKEKNILELAIRVIRNLLWRESLEMTLLLSTFK